MRGSLTQLQVIHALLLRETKTRFGDSHLGYLWALLEPLMWIGTFAGFYAVFGRLTPPGMSMVAFLATGIVPFSLFRDTATKCMVAIASNTGLLFYPQVRPLDLVIARAVLEIVTHFLVLVVLLGGLAMWEGMPTVNDPLQMLGGLALASGLGLSLGLVCCGLNVFVPTFERLFPTFTRLFFWFSALFHPLESTPKPMRDLMLLNPVAHAIEMTRSGWFPGYSSRYINPYFPLVVILVLLFSGLTLERMARRKLELSG